MKLEAFSPKQMQLLCWWCDSRGSANRYNAVIADGAVRSGKTMCMSLSFISWAFSAFHNQAFAFCGKTVTSLRRNVITPLYNVARGLGFEWVDKVSKNYIDVSFMGRRNRFYLFGGKDEGSASLIQGVTLAGVMLDEVALMPRSFVEQALARCSVEGSKFWFNCNPEHPFHWFYLEWIKKAHEKQALYLHFKMEDNPSLSSELIERYHSLYTGTFYERFIEGKWVQAEGLIYPMFMYDTHVAKKLPANYNRYYISCDYGTVNPTSMGLWGEYCGIWYRVREYYYDSRRVKAQRTDEEHYQALKQLSGGLSVNAVVVDPSAASFIEVIRRHGEYRVIPAKNDVLSGIRRVADALKAGKLMFSTECKDSIREFSVYAWEDTLKGDQPRKEFDHAMDDIRYFVSTILALEDAEDDFFVISSKR